VPTESQHELETASAQQDFVPDFSEILDLAKYGGLGRAIY
jgi:hypothetical protein